MLGGHLTLGTGARVVGAAGLCALLAGCGMLSPASDLTAPPTVRGATGFTPAAGRSTWSLTAGTGTLQVRGRASSVAYVALGLTAPACGPTRVQLGSSSQDVVSSARAVTTVALDDHGRGAIAVSAATPACAGGQPPLVVGPAVTTLLGSSWAPWVEPVAGFDLPEPVGNRTGWWMTSDRAQLRVHGQPAARVEVLLDLAPTPCGPATVTVVDVAHAVTQPISVRTRLTLDASGLASVPVEAASAVCRPGADTRPLRAMVFAPMALAVR